MKHKNTILFHKDWQPLINSLPQDAQIEFWQLFMSYEPNNTPEIINPIVVPIWTFIQSQLDKFNDKYEQNVVERNRLNGSKGGRPKKSETNPKNPMGYLETQKTLNKNKNINNNENDNNNNKVKKPAPKKNIPEFEEFKNYALEKKEDVCLNALKLKYESWKENNWKNGNGKKIINWKSTLLNTLPYLKEKSSAKKENTGTPKPTTSKYSEL